MYDKKSIRVLAGGLNFLLPGDSIDDSEAQELTNFSTDSFGALRSRRGHTLRYNVGGEVVSMIRSMGSLWVAAGGNVYKDGALIISGVSSDRVGLVGFKSFLWAMSEADQRKSDGTNDWKWIPEAPETKPTIKPASPVETTVVDLSGGFDVDPSGDENYDEGYLEIKAQTDTVYTAEKTISLDLFTNFSLDDIFRIRCWCRNWKRINRVVFEIEVNDGTWQVDYYTAEMLKSKINAGAKETVTFYLRKRPQNVDVAAKDKKRYGSFERIGATPDKDYRSCVKVRIKVDFEDTTKFRVEEWVLVGDSENTLEGDDFRAFYTHTTAAGHESNPSPMSDPITVNRTGVDASDMVASPDAQVTGQNVYLTGGTLQAVYRVNKNTPIVGATYQIRKTDDELSGDNLQLEDDHSQPPEVSGAIGPYYGRIIAFGNRRYYWSHINKPYAFAFPDDISRGDWNSVEEGVGELLAATMRPGVLFLYGSNNLAVVQGDPGFDSAVHASAIKMGIQSARGVAQSPRGDLANLGQGLYLVNGDGAQLLSKKIDRVFKLDGFDSTKATIGFQDDIAWISDGTLTYRIDLTREWWVKDSRQFSCFYSDEGTLIGATPSGSVLELESGYNDAGASFPVAFTSKAYDAGILDHDKLWDDFTLKHNTGGATLTVVAILNDGESTVSLGTISSTGLEREVLRFGSGGEGVYARNCAIRITGSVSAECLIKDMALNVIPQAREGKSYNTDKFDCGTFKPKIFKALKIDIENDSEVSIKLKTDVPNHTMSVKDTSGSIGIDTEQRTETYVFPAEYIGRLGQIITESSGYHKMFKLWVLHQVIGSFLSGDRDEYYKTDMIDLGEERVKLYKEIEVEYATAGTALLKVETELPSGALAEVTGSPFTLTGTGGIGTDKIQTRKIRLKNNAKGRLIQMTITPTGDFRLEALRMFFKLVGMPNATSWQWYPLPLVGTQPAVWSEIALPPDSFG